MSHNTTSGAGTVVDAIHLDAGGLFSRTELTSAAALLTSSGAWWLDGAVLNVNATACQDGNAQPCEQVSQRGLVLAAGKGRVRWRRRSYALAQ